MEKFFKNLSLASALTVFVLLVGIFVSLYNNSKPAIDEYGFNFITDSSWGIEVPIEDDQKKTVVQPSKEEANESIIDDEVPDFVKKHDAQDEVSTKTIYGGLVPIVGTIFSTLIAMLFAIPIAMGIAIYLAEIAPKNIAAPVGVAIELLAAIPSIIFGMWGMFYFAPIIQNIFGGYQVSLLTAGLVLGIMILPFMAAITRDSMKTTPDVLKESAYAMGATKFEVIKDVVFPYSKAGIIGSIILALGRALGETMAVAFLIGSVFELPKIITDPTISITVAMANNFGEASGLTLNALFYLSLILFVISFGIISLAKFYFLRKAH
jgi:phosphate transport system permease protein